MNSWRRDPLLVFFAAGAVLFLAYASLRPNEEDPVSLADGGLSVLLKEYELVTGEPPSAAQQAEIVEDFYRREILYREALRAELHRSNPRLREALIEEMQQRVSGELPEPSGKELVNYYGDHMDRYYREASISFEQRFFTIRPTAVEGLIAALENGEVVSSDPPPEGSFFPAYGESMIRGLFGPSVLQALQRLPLNAWHGPFESSSGWHFLRVEARRGAELMPYASVADQVLADYQASVLDQRLRAYVEVLRERYPLQSPRSS